ncbi:unnamed protein product [Rhizophagus irregularis]|nr:unnamed protein product [Rhizophagus irregularis]
MDQLTNHKLKIDFLLSDNTSLDLPQQTTIKPNRKRKMTILCSECNQKRKRLDENHQICQAIWVDGPTTITWNEKKYENYEVVLKKLNNYKGITSKELNELKIFHEFSLNRKIKGSYGNNVSRYFGITQDPVTNDIMIIMPHYELGDLGLSKSATEITDDDNNKENYAADIYDRVLKMWDNERITAEKTKIIQSSDIGPVTKNNPGAIYRSRPLSGMIQSAMFTMSTRSLRSQSITAEFELSNYHQKNDISFNGNYLFKIKQIENSFNDEDKFIKKVKLIENENNDYTTQEFELDINIDSEQFIDDERYTTLEIDFDI